MFEDLSKDERDQMHALLRQSGSVNKEEAITAQKALAYAITTPLRQGLLVGDNIGGIFASSVFDPNARIEYPIDFYRPDNAQEFTAYVIPNQGKIPQRQVEGDYLTVPTYDIGAGIDWLLRYARDARWDIVGRALQVLEAGFVKKLNDDGWHTILAAGFDRNIVVNDTNASSGQFTKRLISLMKLVMRRNSGGNATSLNLGKLTHLFVSPESLEDMRNWGLDQIDPITQREIYITDETEGAEVFGVKIVPVHELGEGQEYQLYYQNIIAAGAANSGMASGSVELAIGLDLAHEDSFVMPIREELQVFEDETLHRERRAGFYSWMSGGFAVLNNQRTLLGSL